MSYGDPYAPPPPPYGRGVPPPNHLVMAIVATVVFCLPFGIVSLVYANRVNTLWHAGDVVGAAEASRKAKTWWIVSLVVFAAAIVVYILAFAVFATNANFDQF